MSKPFAIKPIHDLLLRGSADMPVGLYHLHLATAEQLTRLHYKAGMITHVKRRLKALVDNNYVRVDATPIPHYGPKRITFSALYYYTLGLKGVAYLRSIGYEVEPSFRAGKEIGKSYLHMAHALELNDVYIAAFKLKMVHEQYHARFIHERKLKQQPYEVTLPSGQLIRLIPDGVIDFRQRRPGQADLSMPVFLEHDRGSEHEVKFRSRIRAYRTHIRAGLITRVFNAERAVVAFSTFAGMKRVADMRNWTWEELHGDPTLLSLFVFANLPKPPTPEQLLLEPRWYGLTDNQPFALLER